MLSMAFVSWLAQGRRSRERKGGIGTSTKQYCQEQKLISISAEEEENENSAEAYPYDFFG